MNAPAAAIPNARRTVVRWLGVIGLHRSGLTRARARRASHGGVAARAAGSSDGSGMAEDSEGSRPNGELPASSPCPCHATKMKCPEWIVVQEQREYACRPAENVALAVSPATSSTCTILSPVSRYAGIRRRGRVDDAHRSVHTGCIASHLFRPNLRGHPDERLKRHSDDHIGSESITRPAMR